MLKHWIDKFRYAFRGIGCGMVGQSSFAVHLPVAAMVMAAAWATRCSWGEICLLLLCIALVLSLELMNSAVECLAKGLCREHNPQVGQALDIASAAVLIAAITSAAIGTIILGNRLLIYIG